MTSLIFLGAILVVVSYLTVTRKDATENVEAHVHELEERGGHEPHGAHEEHGERVRLPAISLETPS